MTCVTCIIAGDGPIIEEVKLREDAIAHFRKARFNAIYTQYHTDESLLTEDDVQFIFRCASDILDHLH